jgi:actin-related protein 10
MIKSTRRAGARLTARLTVLLSRFAQYLTIPKFGQSSLSTNTPKISKPTPIPPGLLTPAVVEDIKTRLLFVSQDRPKLGNQTEASTQSLSKEEPNNELKEEQDLNQDYSELNDHQLLDTLERIYKQSTSPQTQDMVYKLPIIQPSQSNPRAPCVGVIRIPAWIRERASEILFNPTISQARIEKEEEESLSIPEVILESLLKLPIDLRRPIIRNLVVSGGSAMLPGFLSRLKSELILTLEEFQVPPSVSSSDELSSSPTKKSKKQHQVRQWLQHRRKYSPLYPLSGELKILNHFEDAADPPANMDAPARSSSARPPQFQMNLLAWIGGSLAGSMKIGGQEVIRERWDSVVESSLVSQELELHHQSSSGGANLGGGFVTLDELDEEEEEEEEEEENEEQIEYQRKLVGLRIASSILPDWATLSLN